MPHAARFDAAPEAAGDLPQPSVEPAIPDARWAPILAASAVVALVTAAILGVRLASVVRHGDLFRTTGGEAPQVYPVWKVQNGLPVYEPYSDHNLSGSFFNFSFYPFYGWTLRALGVTGSGLVLGVRLLTLAFGALGAVVTWSLMWRLAGGPPDARSSAFLASMAFLVWFGSTSMSWFLVLARPDAAALALATAGLYLYVLANARRSAGLSLAASLAFFAAWSFKQSTVGILTGVSLHAILAGRDLRRAVALIAPCALLMAATLVLGGPAYRFNTLTVEASLPLDTHIALPYFAQNLAGHLLIWGVLLAALVSVARRGAWASAGGEIGPVVYAAAFTIVWTLFTSGRVGSNKNHLLEMTVSTTILASVLVVRAARRPGGLGTRTTAAVALLTLSMAALPLAQLVFFNRYGRLTLASDAEHAAKAALAAEERRRPKPLLARDEMLGLPWYSSDGRYPAFVLDPILYDRDRLGRMIDEGYFRTLILPEMDEMYGRALRAGYVVEPPVPAPRASRSASFRRQGPHARRRRRSASAPPRSRPSADNRGPS